MTAPTSWRLYGLLDLGYVEAGRLSEMASALIAGGVDVLQLRAKGWEPHRLLPLAVAVCTAIGRRVPLIINDHPEVAAACGADGVHLGQDDVPVAMARRTLPAGSIVGKSTHSPEQVRAALEEGADYLGFGPIFPTGTKPDYHPVGLEHIAEIHRLAGSTPVFCIGGIREETLGAVQAAGGLRVAVVSALLQAPSPQLAAARLKERLRSRPTD